MDVQMNVNDEGMLMGVIGIVVVMIIMMAVSLKGHTIQVEDYGCNNCMVDLDIYVDDNNVTWITNREEGIVYRVPSDKM